MTTTEQTQTMVRSLERVKPWSLNPRQGELRGVEELMASLQTEGLQDAIHVWERADGDYLLKGHRRFEAMRRLGWDRCRQVVLHFPSEEAAYLYLLQDHGHTDPLDNHEKIVAAQHGVSLGLTAAEVAAAVSVKEERVQLWLDLGRELPTVALNGIRKGALAIEAAAEILKVEGKEARLEAAQMVMEGSLGYPMPRDQARAFVEQQYLRPARWRKEWLVLMTKLKKKLPMAEGYQFAAWEDRLSYVMGESGQPAAGYEYAEGHRPRDPMRRTWGQCALAAGVPVWVVPAPLHKEEHVLVVGRKLLLDAESVGGGGASEGDGDGVRGVVGGVVGGREGARVEDEEEDEDENEVGEGSLRCRFGALRERLAAEPALAMRADVWAVVLPVLGRLALADGPGRVRSAFGVESAAELSGLMGSDAAARASMRWGLLLALCLAVEGDGVEKALAEVEGLVGV